jgi:hypothetical protein
MTTYSHAIFLSTPLHWLTAAIFITVVSLLLVGGAIEIVQLLRIRKGRS